MSTNQNEILKTVRDGDQVHMTVRLSSGAKERWTYEREITSSGVSYNQVNREDVR